MALDDHGQTLEFGIYTSGSAEPEIRKMLKNFCDQIR
jgi:hypothetical protein